jgi:hypothetical protein
VRILDPHHSELFPGDVQERELPYIRELVNAYGERECCTFVGHTAVENDQKHGPHLAMQRERFFDADAFLHYYRDNTSADDIVGLRREVYHGIYETHREDHHDGLARVDAVMKQAASTQPSGTLGKYARVPVKQGICHHFVNEGRLKMAKDLIEPVEMRPLFDGPLETGVRTIPTARFPK